MTSIIKRLNIYIPPHQTVKEDFLEKVADALTEDIEICLVEGEVATICEVGFSLNPFAKLAITQDLQKNLVEE